MCCHVHLQAMNTGSDAMWTRQGLWAPAWLLRGAMQQLYSAASASVLIAGTLMRGGWRQGVGVLGSEGGVEGSSCVKQHV